MIKNQYAVKKVARHKRVYCSITKHLAYRLTTNPKLFPDHLPSLFDSVQEGVSHE